MSSPTPHQGLFLVPAVPRLQRYIRQIYDAKHTVLQYNRSSDMLSGWTWPTNIHKERIRPAELLHCESNNIQRPGCLCPLKDKTKPVFVEASIGLVDNVSGEYIAKCAEDSCGYVVRLERIYEHRKSERINIRSRYQEGSILVSPPLLAYLATQPSTPEVTVTGTIPESLELGLVQRNRLKRSYAHLDINETFTIPVFQPLKRRASETEILLKLDDYSQPGLCEKDFRALLGRMAKCPCGMIMSQRVFKEHRCEERMVRPMKRRRVNISEIIDLTLD